MTTPYGAPMPSNLPESPLSINFRVPEIPGGPQLTVRAGNGTELAGLTEDVARHGAQIGHALTEFRAGFLAGSGMPTEAAAAAAAPQAPVYQAPPEPQQYNQGPPPSWAAPATPQAQYSIPAGPPQTGGQPAAPMCPHGQRVWRSGVNKNGAPYKMWACPAPQGADQCKPEWVK